MRLNAAKKLPLIATKMWLKNCNSNYDNIHARNRKRNLLTTD